MAAREWPLRGRDQELAEVLEVLGAGRGVVIAAAAGVGKSRFAAAVVDRIAEGWSVERFAATPSTMVIPFGALARLVDGSDRAASDPPAGQVPVPALDPPDLLSTLRHLRASLAARADGRPLVLVVDDAHLLDDASAVFLQQVAVTGEARLLVTVRLGAACPEPVVALWKDEYCDRLELAPLARGDVAELVAAAHGSWFEQQSIDRLFDLTGGNVMLLRELLARAASGGGITEHGGLLRWTDPEGGSRLDELVRADLDRLDGLEREFVELLALGDPLPLAAARALAPIEVLASVERAGILTVDQLGDGQVRLAHPLFGEALRATLGPLQVELLEGRLADAFEKVSCRLDGDRLRAVAWRLGSGGGPSLDELEEAARTAMARGDLALAERLARAAHDRGGPPEVQLLLAQVLELAGEPREASELLVDLPARLSADRDRAAALCLQIRLLSDSFGRPLDAEAMAAQAARIDDSLWRDFVDAQWATTLALLGRLAEASPIGLDLFAHEDDRVRLRALPVCNLVALADGRIEEGLAATQAMIPVALGRRDEIPSGVSWVFSALVLDLFALGRVDEVDQLLDFVATDPSSALPAGRAFTLLVSARVALDRGRPATARRALVECAGLYAADDCPTFLPVALGWLVEANALLGDGPAAERALEEVGDRVANDVGRLFHLESLRARAWAPFATGDRERTIRRLLDAADTAAAGGFEVFESAALHDAVRLGASSAVVERLSVSADGIDGSLARARHDHARALLAGDPAAVEASGEAFERMGFDLVAAGVFGDAARGFADQGIEAGARRNGARARTLLARCERAQRSLVVLPSDGPALSPRESQIAHLAAGGMSSREIAEELSVSVRTVDNQLSRTYAKLGISGRGDLARVLGVQPREL